MGDGKTEVRNTIEPAVYPSRPADRNRWILERRGPKNTLDPWRAYSAFWEEEMGPEGMLVPTATLLLTNTECPFRCVMCDLWRNTLDEPTPRGAIAAQIRSALAEMPSARQIKLYNAGSFFDPRAIPPEDDAEVAALLEPFDRVVVECHPAFIGERCARFAASIRGRLEVAAGLETVHPAILERLNKRMTVDDFRRAAAFLGENGIDLRVFLLVRTPWMSELEGLEWARRSLDVAFEAGATACTLIPTRAGNGAMDALSESGAFSSPRLSNLEVAQEYGLSQASGRVFSDTWDVEKFFDCACSPARAARLEEMNRTQRIPAPAACGSCGPGE